MEDNHSLYS